MGRLAQKTISKHKTLVLEFREMRLARPDFEDAVIKVRRKYNVRPEVFLETYEAYRDEIHSLFDNSALDREIKSLIQKFNLPDSWFEILFYYVISNGIAFREGMLKENMSGLVLEQRNAGLESMELVLKIGRETTYDDLKEAWEEIKRVSSIGRSRKRKRDNFLRDLDIFKYHNQGLTVPQICLKIEETYEDELSGETVRKVVTEAYERYATPQIHRKKLRLR